MAQGDIVASGSSLRSICLLSAVTTANGQPSAATDGVPVYNVDSLKGDNGASFQARPARESAIFIKGSGSGTVSGTFRMWGYLTALGQWVPVGTGADATKGTLNAGTAIGEVKSDLVLHVEPFLMAGLFDRLYLEVVSTSGSGLSFTAWLTTAHRIAY